MPNRKAAEQFIIKYIDALSPGSPNTQMYVDRFKQMSDKEFDTFMKDIREGKKFLRFILPNFASYKIKLKNNYKIMRELGVEPFQQVWVPERNGVRSYLTPNKYLVCHFPHNRQAQLLSKKISIPKDDRSVDQMSGQVTGSSKGASMSAPETHCLIAMGLESNLLEMMKIKGGDAGAYSAHKAYIDQTGEWSLSQVDPYSTGVQSTKAVEQHFRAAHIKINLSEK